MLRAFGIGVLADIRTVTRSARNPQFNASALNHALAGEGIEYVHIKELGGLRRAKRDSVNGAWENRSFRGYADHMLTEEFERGLQRLVELARQRTTAMMCAEAVPWRCHRTLVADAAFARGIHVEHIMSVQASRTHQLTRFARLEGDRVWYPG